MHFDSACVHILDRAPRGHNPWPILQAHDFDTGAPLEVGSGQATMLSGPYRTARTRWLSGVGMRPFLSSSACVLVMFNHFLLPSAVYLALVVYAVLHQASSACMRSCVERTYNEPMRKPPSTSPACWSPEKLAQIYC